LLKDLHGYGADTETALKRRYGHIYQEAVAEKLLMRIATAEGECFYLNYKARKILGLAPNHVPPPWVAQTHLYRRSVIKKLKAEGYELQGWFSKSLLHFSQQQKELIVAAKHDGYSSRSIRRILRKLRQSSQLQPKLVVFTPNPNRLRDLAKKHQDLVLVNHQAKS